MYYDGLAPSINERATDTQVLILERDGVTFVVFPGTASFQDGLTDLRFIKNTWPLAGRVHAGFRDAFFSVQSELSNALHDAKNTIVTGHSLGGALATLTAHWLGERVTACYTFGSPRVGDFTFARYYNAQLHDQTFRVVNEDDPVTRVPFFLYRHVGTRVFLHNDGRVEINPPMWRGALSGAQQLSLQAAGRERTSFLSQHNIREYVRKLA